MNITQINEDNITGFFVKEGTDYGMDADGNQAKGYQHHDGLWWSGGETPETTSEYYKNNRTTITQQFSHLFSVVAKNIIDTYNPSTVLELGSGSGQLAYELRKWKPDITTVTVDANRTVNEKSPFIHNNHFLARTDQELDFVDDNGDTVLFDLVVSLEHFEHVPPETFDTLMKNVVEHSKDGTKLICTVADWNYEENHQKHVHCNIKSYAEWKEYIESFGFYLNERPFEIKRGGDSSEIFATKGEH